MIVAAIPIIVGALGTGPKNLGRILNEPKISGRTETIQTTALLESAWILKKKSPGERPEY